MYKKLLILSSIIAFAIFSVFAQEEKITDTELQQLSIEELLSLNVDIDVVSTKGEKIFTSPSTVTVINNDEIEKYAFQNISEALQTVAGFSVIRTYLKRNVPTSRGILQDHYANKVLVLINGVPSWHAVTGEGSLDRININDVERIEVLKGPASVLYGTNAYSGAVNIVLKKAEATSGSAHMGFGQYHSYDAGGNVYHKKEDFEMFFSGNISSFNGPDKTFLGEDSVSSTLNDYHTTKNATLRTRYKCHSILFNGFSADESYYGVIPKFSSGAGNNHKIDGYLLNYNFNRDIKEKVIIDAGFTYDWQMRNLSRTATDDVRANILGYRLSAFAKANINITDFLDIEVGGDYDYRYSIQYKNYMPGTGELVPKDWTGNISQDTTLDGNLNMANVDQHEVSGFGQAKLSFDKFSAIAGARYSHNEFFGGNLSGRASFVYALTPKNSIKVIYGESYRSPSLFEQSFVYSTVLGNNELEPEKNRSIEIAFLSSFDNFFMQILGYYAMYENKIQRQRGDYVFPDGRTVTGINIYQNGEQFEAGGAELEIKYANPKIITGFINYGLVVGNANDSTGTGKDHYNFKYVPMHTVSAGLNRTFAEKFGIAAILNYWSSSEGPFGDVDASTVVDLNISYKHTFNHVKVSHILAVKNVLDQDYLVPEYVRRKAHVNSVPYGYDRMIAYTMKLQF